MNNYYTLRHLSVEFKDKLTGCTFDKAVSSQKNRLDFYFQSDSKAVKLSVFTNSANPAIFLVSPQPHKKKNFASFFDPLSDVTVNNVFLAESDRLLSLSFTNDSELMFHLFGNNPNVFLINDNRVTESYKKNDEFSGKIAPSPRIQNPKEPEWKGSVRSYMLSINPALPRAHLHDIIFQHKLEEKSPKDIEKLTHQLSEALLNRATAHLTESKALCTIPEDFLNIPRPYTFNSYNDAVRECFYSSVERNRFEQKKNQYVKQIEKALKKISSRKKQLDKSLQNVNRAETYEQYGHILMANVHLKPEDGAEFIILQDFYEDNNPVKISMKPGLSIHEMAAHYYDKSKNVKTSFAVAQSMQKETDQDLAAFSEVSEAVAKIKTSDELNDFEQKYSSVLRGLHQKKQKAETGGPSFLSKELGGYEILIGRSATNNDELLRYSHKEDIWLHARGVGGSHVIVRMGGSRNFPDKKIIEFAAGWAAAYSKSAGAGLAPVMYTKRKQVRKPKGADPGKVIAVKEQVILVEPFKKQT